MLEVKKLSKKYPGEDLGAVSNVSFKVNSGEIVSIIGQSGSGKTTLLRMLAGLMKPDSGEVIFNGEPLLNPEEQLIAGHDAIKMVFQDYDLMPNMTVKENVGYKLLTYDSEFKEERTNALLTLCGLAELGKKLPRELSGGQQQRLSLARALADDPEVLLMDEPFSNLDPISKQGLLMEVQKISKEVGVALVCVTHDTRDAMMISDRIGYMEDGKLIQIDHPEQLYHHPLNVQVAQFLGLINTIDVAEVTLLGLEDSGRSAGTLILRAEDIRIEQTGSVEALVEECRFLGKNYLIRARLNSGKDLLLYSESSFRIGENVLLKIIQENGIYFD